MLCGASSWPFHYLSQLSRNTTDVSVTEKFYARWADEELKERHSRFSPLADSDL